MNLLTIFVFVLIILLIYMVYKLMTTTTTTISGFSDASKTLTVPSDETGGNNYGYSVWIYIDKWVRSSTSTTTVNKNVVTRCDAASNPLFTMHLDNDQNNLNVVMKGNESAPCTIRNVQLQKWINLTMSVYGNTLDLYLDGKLVRTCIMKTLPTHLSSGENVYIGGGYTSKGSVITPQDGDLNGYISNVVYKNNYFTPEEAWSIYSDGYSGAGMINFINSYKLVFGITHNNQTIGQFSI